MNDKAEIKVVSGDIDITNDFKIDTIDSAYKGLNDEMMEITKVGPIKQIKIDGTPYAYINTITGKVQLSDYYGNATKERKEKVNEIISELKGNSK